MNTLIVFLEHQWNFTKDHRLVNHGVGFWKFDKNRWNLPVENHDGYIQDQETNQVLGVVGDVSYRSRVQLQTKDIPENPDQKWHRVTNNDGFLLFRNGKSDFFLSINVYDTNSYPIIESKWTI